jgi:hypothetical protein
MSHTSRNKTEQTDSFDGWRQNTNQLAADVGDKTQLHSDLIDEGKHTVVDAINETYNTVRHNLIKALGMS